MPNPAQSSDFLPSYRDNRTSHIPSKAMPWYEAVIDDMLSHPGTSIKDTAARLGRSPVTVGYVMKSDLFKTLYAQRREQYNEELDQRLVGKLAKVAELSLDLTLEQLEKKRTAIPLPLLHDISSKSLERLGYGVKPSGGPAVQVNVQQNSPQVAAPVSAEALQSARQSLRTIEASRSDPRLPLPHIVESGWENEPPAQAGVAGGVEEEL